MKKFILIFICAVLVFSMMTACGDNRGKSTPDSADPAQSTTAPEEARDLMAVKTPYADIKVPEDWKEDIDISVDDGEPCTASFVLKKDKTPVFDLIFGEVKGSPLGVLHQDDGDVPVSVVFYEIDPKSKEYDRLAAVRDDINVIIAQLVEDYGFDTDTSGLSAQEVVEVYRIETGVVPLYYPKKWQNDVTVAEKDNVVQFTYQKISLFDIAFGGNEGARIGSYNGKDVFLISYDPELKDLDDSEKEKVYAMMDDLNVVIEYLGKEKGFES